MARNQGTDITEEAFRQACGLPEVDLVPWTAERYAEHLPPMDGGLIDAVADPFRTDADWIRPGAKGERAAMAKQLDEWWSAIPAKAGGTVAQDQVGSRFSAVVAARILRARLAQLDEPGRAMALAEETFDLAWKAFQTAPGTMKSDVMPAVVMAAESAAQTAAPGTDPAAAASLRKKLDVSLFRDLAVSLPTDFGVNRIPKLVGQFAQGADLKATAQALDPLGGDEEGQVASGLKTIWANPNLLDPQATVDSAKAIVDTYRQPPKGFAWFESRYKAMEGRTVATWGQNMVGIDPSRIDWAKAAIAAKAKNPVGILLLAEVERQWLVALESAFVLQMQFDAARIRFQRAVPSTDDSEPLDPLTGGPYVVDEKANVLRTTLTGVDPKFIFVNQAVMHGVPLRH